MNCKSQFWMFQLKFYWSWVPDRYSTSHSTLSKGQLSSYFWITIPGRVISRNLNCETYALPFLAMLPLLVYIRIWFDFAEDRKTFFFVLGIGPLTYFLVEIFQRSDQTFDAFWSAIIVTIMEIVGKFSLLFPNSEIITDKNCM